MRLFEYLQKRERRLAFPWMGVTGLRLTGYKMHEVYLSPQKHLELARLMDREFKADFIYPLDDGAVFVETLGLPLLQPDYDFPSVLENPLKTVEDIEKLEIPDPYASGRMPLYLEALRLIAGSSEKPLAISLQGPFTLGVELVGVADFSRAIIRRPAFVEAVLDFSNRIVTAYAEAVVKAGVRFLCVSEPTAVILSPERFEALCGRRLRDLFDRLPPDVWRVLHICGDTNYLLPQMLECGAEGLSLDQVMDLPETAKKAPEDVVIIGNLDPIYVLREMDQAGVRERTLELLKSMKDFPNFLFSFGCDCTPDTPLENLKAAMAAARTRLSDL